MRKEYSRLIILSITGVVVIGLISAVFWFKNYSRETRVLADFVPTQALGYIEFNLADENFNKYLNESKEAKRVLEEFILSNELPANIWRGEVEIDKLGLILMRGQNKAWLIHGRENVLQLEATELVDYYYAALNEETAVLARSQEAMSEVRNYKALSGFGLKREESGFLYGYAKREMWHDEWRELIESLPLLERIELGDQIGWRFEMDEEGETVFEVEVALNNGISLDKRKRSSENFLMVDKSMMMRGILAEPVLALLAEELERGSEIEWEIFEFYLGDKYSVKIEELYTFFDQPVILVLRPKKEIRSWEELFKSKSYSYAVVRGDAQKLLTEEFARSLEDLVSNYMAFKFPETKVKTLPDGTTGLELVAGTERFQWQVVEEGEKTIKSLEYEKGEVAYGWQGGRLVVANSVRLAQDILESQEGEVVSNYIDFKLDGDIFNNKYWRLIDGVWLGSEVEGRRFLIRGRVIMK